MVYHGLIAATLDRLPTLLIERRDHSEEGYHNFIATAWVFSVLDDTYSHLIFTRNNTETLSKT